MNNVKSINIADNPVEVETCFLFSGQSAVLDFFLNLLQCRSPCVEPVRLVPVGALHGLARALANAHEAVGARAAGSATELPLHQCVGTQVGPVVAGQLELVRAKRRSASLAAHSVDNLDVVAAVAFALKTSCIDQE